MRPVNMNPVKRGPVQFGAQNRIGGCFGCHVTLPKNKLNMLKRDAKQIIIKGFKINKLLSNKRINCKWVGFHNFQEADWILFIPILNILGGFELSA